MRLFNQKLKNKEKYLKFLLKNNYKLLKLDKAIQHMNYDVKKADEELEI